MKRAHVLYALAAVFVVAALVVFVRNLRTVSTNTTEFRALHETLKEKAEAIYKLRYKCGFETAVVNETVCECEAEKMINARVDEVEEILRMNPGVTPTTIKLDDGRDVSVKGLSDFRLPVSPECQTP